MIAIIDYGLGNLHSVKNALDTLGAKTIITSDPYEIEKADGVILPGVGAFEEAMQNLNKRNLIDVVYQVVKNRTPLLGICLGMQVMFERGYEGQITDGFSFFKGEVTRIKVDEKIPHMGWNQLEYTQDDVLIDKEQDAYVYFVHSFVAANYDEDDLVAYSTYGNAKIPAYFHKGQIYAMQYHPEKSGEVGLAMLKKFMEVCDDYSTSN
ncbi:MULTISPECIES: imidazole glycerol phosphate synthase subunit HisH [unclassified Breznakia]|uniref:imidazole glycerol phosphate synthase subunit HisH n=1 Tax=unclassified Breznakia TaxID=2623764 RepID=UPI002474B9DF|nr:MULTISPECIES: imidazole glycerol phosphate synthase subunit HisH [unclassified Breznakia]MDH6367183.1 glutamine amidotransferase [Breznakia sp. PH1-1]MDH6404397.1 glutamine amidotransferase [Breznakia sp. PF1-11]MDH6412106.1 glutamine amidotransferase [Breznakia sp. PFB1-11]MDH6414385.1 glutamine amidotransferase [Breznakia sp. PFB1-14]MDH6416685.1 glutamine amidotransferase [Breznakia sp. PFB1-4]